MYHKTSQTLKVLVFRYSLEKDDPLVWEDGRYTIFTSSSAVFSTEYHEDQAFFRNTRNKENS